jgi:hypothetical protein
MMSALEPAAEAALATLRVETPVPRALAARERPWAVAVALGPAASAGRRAARGRPAEAQRVDPPAASAALQVPAVCRAGTQGTLEWQAAEQRGAMLVRREAPERVARQLELLAAEAAG